MSGSGISWATCKSAPRSRQITTPAPHHSGFYRPDALPAGPTNSVKALKAKIYCTRATHRQTHRHRHTHTHISAFNSKILYGFISFPSLTHTFIPGLKRNLPFLQILPTAAFPFLLQDWLHGFPRLFAVTSEHIRFYFLLFLFYTF